MDYIINTLYIIPGLLLGFTVHEFFHAFTADRLGDDTPRYQGRLTLSPFAHIDLMGFLAVILIGFGWAKPVQINTRKFKKPRRDHILVSLAGPLSNLGLAIISLVVFKIASSYMTEESGQLGNIMLLLLANCAMFNVILFVFNLMPVPPLDGYSILKNIAPLRFYSFFAKAEKYSSWILLIFVFFVARLILPPIEGLIYTLLLS